MTNELDQARERLQDLERARTILQSKYAGTQLWTHSRIRQQFADNDVAREELRGQIAELERAA